MSLFACSVSRLNGRNDGGDECWPVGRDAMAQPACSLDLAMPCRDAGGTEHRSAAPVTPITWRFAPAATSAVNASHEVQWALHSCYA